MSHKSTVDRVEDTLRSLKPERNKGRKKGLYRLLLDVRSTIKALMTLNQQKTLQLKELDAIIDAYKRRLQRMEAGTYNSEADKRLIREELEILSKIRCGDTNETG